MFRATFKSLLSRKVRLVLSGLAVVLGVMAVSGAFVLTDTLSRSFGSLFRTVTANVDVQVAGKEPVTADTGGPPATRPIPAAVVDQVARVPGVAAAAGDVSADGVRVIGRDGKVVVTQGPPRFGISWRGENGLVELRSGRGPLAPDEVAINAGLARTTGFGAGDRIEVLTLEPKRIFTVVGIFGYTGGRDSLAGETRIAFTEPVAQRLVLGGEGRYSTIDIETADGAPSEQVRDAVQAALGDEFTVRTGEQAAAEQADQLGQFLGLLRNVLLGFAAVALFVGVFLILNTFSILVAQRTRELALFRTLGAGRGQVIGSVLAEAALVGLVASTLGLLAGIGAAAGLKALLAALGGPSFPDAGLSVPISAVLVSYAAGMLVTLAAAALPAWRASRIPPIAAMRDAATGDRPPTGLWVWAGTVPAALGAAGIGAALAGDLGGAMLPVLLGGALLSFAGLGMLTPAISRPVTSTLGRALAWSAPGRLGRRNAARNPRRTAITASALMVGVALVTGVGVIADSVRTSLDAQTNQGVRAELVVSGDAGRYQPTFDPAVIDRARDLPGVRTAVAVRAGQVQVGPDAAGAKAGELDALAQVFGLTPRTGELRTLRKGEIAVSDEFATARGLAPGAEVRLATQREGTRSFTVVGVYGASQALGVPVLVSVPDAVAGFRSPAAVQGFIALADGADTGAVQRKVGDLLRDEPEVTVVNRADFAAQQAGRVDTIVLMLYALLGLAIVIAVLGVVNTLALSVLERTPELGLLRAVGMGRSQVIGMVTVESVVISVFGTLLGVVAGGGLGVAAARALADEGISALSFPWTLTAVVLALGIVIGLAAALVPAVRASRVDVCIRAFAYD